MALDPLALHRTLMADGPAPRLSWRSDDGEQLELSGRVLANWTAKIANLLVEEVDAGPGTRVVLDLPTHWRTLVWALGTWVTGATVVLIDDDEHGADDDAALAPDVVVTTEPESWVGRCDVVVAATLPSFALAWPGTLPDYTLDGSADVAARPDALGPTREAHPDSPALVVGARSLTFAQLAPEADAGPAVLASPDGTVARALVDVIAALGTGNGVVALAAA